MHPLVPRLSAGGMSLLPNFQKGGLDRISAFRGGLLGKGGITFSGMGLQVLDKKETKMTKNNLQI